MAVVPCFRGVKASNEAGESRGGGREAEAGDGASVSLSTQRHKRQLPVWTVAAAPRHLQRRLVFSQGKAVCRTWLSISVVLCVHVNTYARCVSVHVCVEAS